jgi:hypothetical protein
VQTVQKRKKSGECLIIVGDFFGKVGADGEEYIVSLYGLGKWNDNG